MDIDQIYDKIGSNYSYTYNQFLEEFTPKLAERLLGIISVREHNDYCYDAMMHGQDMKSQIIEPKVATSDEKISDKQRQTADKHVADMIKRGRNV